MQKLFFFETTFFLAYFGLWSVIHSYRARYIFSWTMNVTSYSVMFTVPQIWAHFMDNPHNLEIDSFKIAVSEHILLYFKNSNWFFFLCTHDNVRHTLCTQVHGVMTYTPPPIFFFAILFSYTYLHLLLY